MLRTLAIALLLTTPLNALALDWKYSQSVDEFTDELNEYAVMREHQKKQSVGAFCSNKSELLAAVEVGEYIGGDDSNIRYRLDKQRVIKTNWYVNAEGNMVYVRSWAAKAFLESLVDKSSLLFEATDFRGISHSVKFELQNNIKALAKLLASCKNPAD